jgi:hypothetical protein
MEISGIIPSFFSFRRGWVLLGGESAWKVRLRRGAPAAEGHGFDEGEFVGGGGVEFGGEVCEEPEETPAGFAGEQDGLGEDAVLDGVAGGIAASCFSDAMFWSPVREIAWRDGAGLVSPLESWKYCCDWKRRRSWPLRISVPTV